MSSSPNSTPDPNSSSILASLFRRAPQVPAYPPNFPYNWKTNPYKSKRTWPPDFETLSPKHQFRLERRYRRRSKLKWARPNWTKGVKLAQWGSILFVVTYGVLYLDVDNVPGAKKTDGEGRGTVFEGIRKWYWSNFGSGFSNARNRDAERQSGNSNAATTGQQNG